EATDSSSKSHFDLILRMEDGFRVRIEGDGDGEEEREREAAPLARLHVRGTKNTENYFISKYEPTPTVEHWNDLRKCYIPGGDYVPCGEDVNACDEDYLKWYRDISHPFVINKEQQARTDKEKAKAKDGEAKRAQKEMLICEEESVRLWDNVVKKGKKLLKK
ncbi:hypothetical protein C5167_026389, partial [Papaver somniferum]